jgi:hypothetical protein
MKIFTSFVKSTFMLATAMLFSANAFAQDAEEPEVVYSEDFEQVTLVDADSWGRAASLSNGWTLSSATSFFAANAESAEYALVTSEKMGYGESSTFIAADYGSSNSTCILVNKKLSGEISFWVKSTLTSSSKNSNKSYVTIYRATENGEVTNVELLKKQSVTRPAQYSNEVAQWEQYTLDVKDEYIAINLVRCQLDNFVVTAKEVQVVENKELTIDGFELVQPEEWTQYVELGSKIAVEFNVAVSNTGNVELAADEVSVSITDQEENVLGTGTATAAVPAGESATVVVKFDLTANEAKTYKFWVKENLGGTYYTYQSGVKGERSMDVVDITVGINEAKVAQQKAEVYTLGGQRVQKAVKGLYIVNGKKVVVK